MAGQRIAGCRVGGGTRSDGAWLRLRHATSTRPSSPPSYLARLASSRLAASLPPPPLATATTPDLDLLFSSMSFLLAFFSNVSYLSFISEWTFRNLYCLCSWTILEVTFHIFVLFDKWIKLNLNLNFEMYDQYCM